METKENLQTTIKKYSSSIKLSMEHYQIRILRELNYLIRHPNEDNSIDMKKLTESTYYFCDQLAKEILEDLIKKMN